MAKKNKLALIGILAVIGIGAYFLLSKPDLFGDGGIGGYTETGGGSLGESGQQGGTTVFNLPSDSFSGFPSPNFMSLGDILNQTKGTDTKVETTGAPQATVGTGNAGAYTLGKKAAATLQPIPATNVLGQPLLASPFTHNVTPSSQALLNVTYPPEGSAQEKFAQGWSYIGGQWVKPQATVAQSEPTPTKKEAALSPMAYPASVYEAAGYDTNAAAFLGERAGVSTRIVDATKKAQTTVYTGGAYEVRDMSTGLLSGGGSAGAYNAPPSSGALVAAAKKSGGTTYTSGSTTLTKVTVGSKSYWTNTPKATGITKKR